MAAGVIASAAAVASLTCLYWHYLEHWFVHSTVGPNLTATPPGAAVLALPAFVAGLLLRPWAQAKLEAFHARHADMHTETRAVMQRQHAVTHGMLQGVLSKLASEDGPASRSEVAELKALVSVTCPACGGETDVGRLCPACNPQEG